MITSLSNKKIKEAIFVKKKHADYKYNAFFIEGERVLEMALASGVILKRVFYTDEFVSKGNRKSLVKSVTTGDVEVLEISTKVMRSISDTETPQGIAAIASLRKYELEDLKESENPVLLICDRVKEPGNLGSIIRSSDAFGADAVMIVPGTCNPFSPKVIRASAGSIFNIPLIFVPGEKLIPWMKARQLRLLVTDPYGGESIFHIDFTLPFALVLGEEAGGVSKFFKEKADLFIHIPLKGRADSLNVSISAAIILYEAQKQRSKVSGHT